MGIAWAQPYANSQNSGFLNQPSAFPKTLAWNQPGTSSTLYVSSAQTVSLNGSEYAAQASLDGRLRLVTVQTGALAWEAHETGGILGYPSFDDSGSVVVYGTFDSRVVARNVLTGLIQWETRLPSALARVSGPPLNGPEVIERLLLFVMTKSVHSC